MDYPGVGVATIVNKNGKFILLKRKSELGDGCWGFPGGKLEKFEDIEGCSIREVKEETNLDISNIRIDEYTNDKFYDEDKHYITFFVNADWVYGEGEMVEKDKNYDIGWFTWDNLPEPLFLPMYNYIKKKNKL